MALAIVDLLGDLQTVDYLEGQIYNYVPEEVQTRREIGFHHKAGVPCLLASLGVPAVAVIWVSVISVTLAAASLL